MRWKSFVWEQRKLADLAGLPSSIFTDKTKFDDLLMHGHCEYQEDPGRFDIACLSDKQRDRLDELIERYLETVGTDPGISLPPR